MLITHNMPFSMSLPSCWEEQNGQSFMLQLQNIKCVAHNFYFSFLFVWEILDEDWRWLIKRSHQWLFIIVGVSRHLALHLEDLLFLSSVIHSHMLRLLPTLGNLISPHSSPLYDFHFFSFLFKFIGMHWMMLRVIPTIT